MTEQELDQQVKIRAEIANLNAETLRICIETQKAVMEMQKIVKETRWYEVTLAVAATLAIAAISKLIL